MIPEEFIDLMPHRIRVRGTTRYDDYGKALPDQPEDTYVCLLDDKGETQFTLAGTERTVVRVAYMLPYPMAVDGSFATTPKLVTTEGTLLLSDDSEHEITSVETHYDETGAAHNQVVRFD